jgi:hypothetical protein
MSYESQAEPIKRGYLFDFRLPPGFPRDQLDDLTDSFALVFRQGRERGIMDRAFADAHPLTPRGVRDALEQVKMVPAVSGAPGTRLSFGKWTRHGWMGAGYLVARRLNPDGKTSVLVDRFGSD